MVSILIVEDEDIIRKGLVYTVDWLSMDAVVVAACENGLVGLEKIRELKPDVVITDIKMPVLDGLSMIQTAKEEGIDFLPVVLTSYSDFDYARKSITLNVFDYLLKPVSDDKLKELMTRAKTQIEEIRKNRQATELVYSDAAASPESTVILNTTVSNTYVKYALEKIESSWKDHISIESIASELHISASYLSRVFKKECARTFLDFLNRFRIQKAIELLVTGKYRVYEVAEMTGFSDYKRFYETFREYTSIAPTDFKKGAGCVIKG